MQSEALMASKQNGHPTVQKQRDKWVVRVDGMTPCPERGNRVSSAPTARDAPRSPTERPIEQRQRCHLAAKSLAVVLLDDRHIPRIVGGRRRQEDHPWTPLVRQAHDPGIQLERLDRKSGATDLTRPIATILLTVRTVLLDRWANGGAFGIHQCILR
jgi:hypothetical protein